MKRHRTDVLSLAFGLIFILIAIWWALGNTVRIGIATLAWTIAVALILLGGLGLLGALRGRDRDQDRDEWPAS